MAFDENAYQRVRCTSDTPIIRLFQKQQKTVDLVVRDENGDALDLAALVGTDPNGSSSSSGEGARLEVRLAVAQHLSCSTIEFTLIATIIDEATGQVRFEFEPTHTANPGIFVASLGVFSYDILRHQMMHYLEFMPTVFDVATSGPVTVPEVRMHIMDMCPDANYLLDELEFTDAEIIHALRHVVDYFNDLDPPIGGYSYASFPYRAQWLNGAAATLLRMIAHRYRRNSFRYSAGGLQVADQEKAAEYERAAAEGWQQYANWAQGKKISMNVAMAYGNVGPSPYGRGRRRYF